MKKIILVFGLISGAIMSAVLLLTMPFHDRMGGSALLVGYVSMIAAFLLVYFGIRSFRDRVGLGSVSFGRAVAVGMLIVVLASAMYTATWEALYNTVYPDFAEQYGRAALAKARAKGKSEAELAKLKSDMDHFAESYRNPLFNTAVTFGEPLPVGVIMTVVSAGILRRRRRDPEAAFAVA